ncbi:hypothetical protein [uncultured Deinococcus sp.]|uniref:hypothetical protein n=1 Tax=uncultured Deinococcus sp. TaxID=158789 RepID=UPI0025EF0D23|nr:hypothetical protein [uncultured Deinococcus sp.]
MTDPPPIPSHRGTLVSARTILQQVKEARERSGNFAQEITWNTGDPTDAIAGLTVLIDDARFCECEAFGQLVAMGAIRHASHQVLNTATGGLRTIQYYAIGPDDPERSAIIAYCPACAGRVRVNAELEASVVAEPAPYPAPALAARSMSNVPGECTTPATVPPLQRGARRR